MSSFVIYRLATFIDKDDRTDRFGAPTTHMSLSVMVENCWSRMGDVQAAIRRSRFLSEVTCFTNASSKACERRGNGFAQIPSPRNDVVLFWRQKRGCANFQPPQIWRNSLGKREIYKQFTWKYSINSITIPISRPRDHLNRFSSSGT